MQDGDCGYVRIDANARSSRKKARGDDDCDTTPRFRSVYESKQNRATEFARIASLRTLYLVVRGSNMRVVVTYYG